MKAESAFKHMPPMRCVTIEYESGMTVTYEDAALGEWESTYYAAMTALLQMQLLEVQAAQNQEAAMVPERPEVPSNVRTLRSVLQKKG